MKGRNTVMLQTEMGFSCLREGKKYGVMKH